MTDREARAAIARTAELRDAAINASAAAWRVTGLGVCSLLQPGCDYERPMALGEVACVSGDSLGWAALADRARRMANAWSRAAEDWQAAEAQLQIATAEAIAELRRQRAGAVESPQHAALANGNEFGHVPPEALRMKQAFQIKSGPSYRSVSRSAGPNDGTPMGSQRAVDARVASSARP